MEAPKTEYIKAPVDSQPVVVIAPPVPKPVIEQQDKQVGAVPTKMAEPVVEKKITTITETKESAVSTISSAVSTAEANIADIANSATLQINTTKTEAIKEITYRLKSTRTLREVWLIWDDLKITVLKK